MHGWGFDLRFLYIILSAIPKASEIDRSGLAIENGLLVMDGKRLV